MYLESNQRSRVFSYPRTYSSAMSCVVPIWKPEEAEESSIFASNLSELYDRPVSNSDRHRSGIAAFSSTPELPSRVHCRTYPSVSLFPQSRRGCCGAGVLAPANIRCVRQTTFLRSLVSPGGSYRSR